MSDFDELPLGTPARRALAGVGITSLDAAAARSRSEIAALHGVGPRAVAVLEAALADRGMGFSDSEPVDVIVTDVAEEEVIVASATEGDVADAAAAAGADPAAASADSAPDALADPAPAVPATEVTTEPAGPSTPPPDPAGVAPEAPRPATASSYNVYAIVAIATSIPVPILGIVFGHLALRELASTGQNGREMAIAGLVIGYVLTGLILLFVLVWLGFLVTILGSVFSVIPLMGGSGWAPTINA